jgi:hypothetical protein
LSLCATSAADCAEWSAAPTLSWGVDQDSNRLLADKARESQSGTMHLEAQLRRTSENWQLSARPLAEFRRYTNDGSAEADNRSLGIASAWSREHLQWNVVAQLAEESTLTSEVTDTGLIEADSTRRTKSVASTWVYQHSELRALEVQTAFADVDYHGRVSRNLPGYQYPSVSLTERFTVTDRTQFSITAFGSELRTPFRFSESRDTGFRYGVDHVLNEVTRLHFSVGASSRRILGDHDNGYVGDVELTRNAEIGQWRLFYRRELAASGLGYLLERDTAGVSLRRPMTPHIVGSINLQSVQNDNSAALTSAERYRYSSLEAGADWRVAESSTLGLRLGARRAQRTEEADINSGWRAAAVFTWTPRIRTLSR